MVSTLGVWIDDAPRSGPMNMAVDEVLLATMATPLLRVYRWDGPWISIGCFVPLSDAETHHPGRRIVRRWTGGGIVDHTDDWTYSFIVPRHEPLGTLAPASSYRQIHGALVKALALSGHQARLAAAPTAGGSGLCFQSAVAADVVLEGRKIAGAAQRRTRHGLLHQGSLQGMDVPAGLAFTFAQALAADCPPVHPATFRRELAAHAATLAEEKYASAHWQSRR